MIYVIKAIAKDPYFVPLSLIYVAINMCSILWKILTTKLILHICYNFHTVKLCSTTTLPTDC